MKAQAFRKTIRMAAFAATALVAHPSQATLLQYHNSLDDRSFWDPADWFPAQTPGVGDTVRFNNDGFRTFLGDFAAFPAQTRQISRLNYNGTAALHVLNWGSKPGGGQAGGLSFSQDDPADFGVGIRIGHVDQFGGGPQATRCSLSIRKTSRERR